MDIIYQHIKRRMEMMGFCDFDTEPMLIEGTDTVSRSSRNEYLFLAANIVPVDLEIISDNNLWRVSDSQNYINYNLYSVADFTGEIQVSAAGDFSIEFIRVVPKTELTESSKTFRKQYEETKTEKLNELLAQDINY